MKTTIDDLQTTYKSCQTKGLLKEKTVDVELIRSLLSMAEKGLSFITRSIPAIPKESEDWTFVFREHYESLRSLIEAYVRFDGIGADNHQCNNAHICQNHAELELDWNFLETIRLKRNAMNYTGQMMTHDEWKTMELSFKLHISLLTKEIREKLEGF
ncbi:hypothetical protein JW711_06055 [Candidatus Woesearchaeota archaeon]|nr:hypothetical protein [Candidatus Woesearchaeota archaeon]